MTEQPVEYAVGITPEATAIGDGYVDVVVVKGVCWPKISRNYQVLQFGPTFAPGGILVVRVPVEDAKKGQAISPAQLGELFEGILQGILPMCTVFVDAVEKDFGYIPEPEIAEEDF